MNTLYQQDQPATPAASRAARALKNYVTLAGAAAAAAASGSAQAAIVTSAAGWSHVMTASGTNTFQQVSAFGPGATLLNGNLVLSVTYTANAGGTQRRAFAYGVNLGTMRGAKRFAANDIIGNISQISGGTRIGLSARSNTAAAFVANSLGSWQAPTNGSLQGYIAFAISDGVSSYYFGYFDVTVSNNGRTGTTSVYTLTINGWAYNSVAGQSITIGAPAAVPGGAGLAALAVGAAGLRGRRRKG